MGRKKNYYLTLDTETCTLPFANELCKNEKQKQTVAIAKPIVYDIGWTICDRQGNIIKRASYLVQESFFSHIFETAYYKNKRPIYMDRLANGLIKTSNWNDIIDELIEDLSFVEIACAYNACFDFKKAIPFTERWIKAFYSTTYDEWLTVQKEKCERLLTDKNASKNDEYMEPFLRLREKTYPIVDLWGLACEKLVNQKKYKNFCLDNNLLTSSGLYFKSSAETTFQFLLNQPDFEEEHTALSDAEIETEILLKLLKKGKIEPSIIAFPFRELGYTYEYALASKKEHYIDTCIEAIVNYLENNNPSNMYITRLENILCRLGY